MAPDIKAGMKECHLSQKYNVGKGTVHRVKVAADDLVRINEATLPDKKKPSQCDELDVAVLTWIQKARDKFV